MLNCKETTRLISQSLDTTLPMTTRLSLRLHLAMCKFCSRYDKQLHFIQNIMHHYAGEMDDEKISSLDSLPEDARQRIKKVLSQDK